MTLFEKYKRELEEISSKELNQDQKDIAIKILEKFEDKDLEYVFQFVIQRVKTGFRFDAAPESDSQTVALLEKDEKLSFVLDKDKARENTLIIGENYDALKNLLVIEREREKDALNYNYDVIYIDPPYNTEATKNDGNSVANDTENIFANKFIYRDKYSRNGWLNLMNERLKLAKQLLKEDGVIFVSIDDSEQAYLKVLMDEIFGEENFIEMFLWNKNVGGSSLSKFTRSDFEYVICYSLNKEKITNKFFSNYSDGMEDSSLINAPNKYKQLKFPPNTINFNSIENGFINPFKDEDLELHNRLEIENNSNKNEVLISSKWKWSQDKLNEELKNKTTLISRTQNLRIRYIKNNSGTIISPTKSITKNNNVGYTVTGSTELISIVNNSNFNFPKPVSLIKYLIKMILYNNKNSRVLDFFAGSGTTGHAVLELNKEDGGNRTYTIVTNNENNIGEDVTFERLYRINAGKGTKGESFDWLKKNEPYNTNLNVFRIKYYDVSVNSNEINSLELTNKLISLLKEFGIDFSDIKSAELLNKLLALKPQRKD
ncbi:site-specific DNA-methyltransferase [Mycoplasma procyoni]|uniref:site-specific DNA-methyltransferase n=1 Tax=Mycoplasma procyoni TaxID=568784 RepID=UPI00197C1208|nr:site-specific DNA-methyltransferase [Mycoplasma procyoni]MBN3534576.1 site-specific DNA-methyltransferase [Mycoplasma procyoni]